MRGYYLIFCLLLFSAGSSAAEIVLPTADENPAAIALREHFIDNINVEGDDWATLLTQLNAKYQRDLEYDRGFEPIIAEMLEKFRRQGQNCERAVKLYYYKILQYDRNDALQIAFTCEKISTSMRELKKVIAEFTRVRDIFGESMMLYTNIRAPQNLITAAMVPPELRALATENREILEQMNDLAQKWQVEIAQVGDYLHSLNVTLAGLEAFSKKRQDEVIAQIFFANEMNLLSVLPSARTELTYWLSDIPTILKVKSGRLVKYGERFLAYAATYLLFFALLAFAVYRYALRGLLQTGAPDIFAARYKFRNTFFVLLFGFAVYAAAISLDGIDWGLWQQISSWLLLTAILRLTLLWRLSATTYATARWLYGIPIVAYLGGMGLNLTVIQYPALVIMGTLFGAAALIANLYVLRRWADLPPIDRVYGMLGVLNYAAVMWLSAIGYAFIALSMLLGWLVVVAILQTIATLGSFIQRLKELDKGHPLFHEILQKVFLPLGWAWMLIYLTEWLTRTFNLESKFAEFLEHPIVWEQIASFTPKTVLMVGISGLGVYFALYTLRSLLHGLWSEKFAFGILPSVLILGSYITWGVYLISALTMFNVQYSSILVVLGGMSMGLGFGLKDIVENFIAGLILLVGQQLRPGDEVEIISENIYGKIVKITVRSTVVETCDGARRIFPNAQVLTKDFRNWTSNNLHRRVSLFVGVRYGSDLAKVSAVIMQAVQTTNGVLASPVPEVLYKGFGESSIDIEIRCWVSIKDYMPSMSHIRERIYAAFNEQQIEIPFPQLDLHVKGLPRLNAVSG